MALTYSLYYALGADGRSWANCWCDLPPAWVAQDFYADPYRDLSAQGVDGLVTIPADGSMLVQTDITTNPGTLNIIPIADPLFSVPDDESHTPFRQDTPHKEDVLVFTDSLGKKCGEFRGIIYPSWSNAGPPMGIPTKLPTINV